MKLQKFEVILDKDVSRFNERVNARVSEGWDVMFGPSRTNDQCTKFVAWMVLPLPPKSTELHSARPVA